MTLDVRRLRQRMDDTKGSDVIAVLRNTELIPLLEAAETLERIAKSEACQRLLRYVEMRTAKPMNQLGDVVHGIHTGTEWEAELRLSDMRQVCSLLHGTEGQK